MSTTTSPLTASRETWRAVVGYEGLYEVSDLGRVRSLPRAGGNSRLYGGKILKAQLKRSGYLAVSLHRNGTVATRRVHCLVALAFIGPRPPGQVVRHGPAGALDNSVANICWGTLAENSQDRYRDGTARRPDIQGEKHRDAILTWAIVRECRHRYASGEAGQSLARTFGVSYATMAAALNGKSWRTS